MTDTIDTADAPRSYGFAIGLMTGTCVGAGLMLWLAPKAAAELRRRVTDSAKHLGDAASARYEEASATINAVVNDTARRGRDVSDHVVGSVGRGAHEVARAALTVERAASAATSSRG